MLEALINIDHQLFMLLNGTLTFSFLDWFMPFITDFKNTAPIILLIWLSLLIFGNRKMRFLGLAMLVAAGITDLTCARLIKPAVARQRPCSLEESATFTCRLLLPKKSSKSFPSNHAANTAAVAITVFLFTGLKIGLPVLAIAAVIGYSRIYCGVHFPLDVGAGWLVGGLIGCLTARFLLPRAEKPEGNREIDAGEHPADPESQSVK